MASPEGPWKSKEKQSRLIHTAPIHQPTSPVLHRGDGGGSYSGGGGSKGGHAQIDVQLRQLEGAYGQAKKRVSFQKRNAVRWIKRQSQRMHIQLNAMEKEKKLLGQHLEREERALADMENTIIGFEQLLLESYGTELPQQVDLGHMVPSPGGKSSAMGGGRERNTNGLFNGKAASTEQSNSTRKESPPPSTSPSTASLGPLAVMGSGARRAGAKRDGQAADTSGSGGGGGSSGGGAGGRDRRGSKGSGSYYSSQGSRESTLPQVSPTR